jgi:hypothetical protein
MASLSVTINRTCASARDTASSSGDGGSGPSTAGSRGGGGGSTRAGGGGTVGVDMGPAEGGATTGVLASTRGRCGRSKRATAGLLIFGGGVTAEREGVRLVSPAGA